MNIKLFAVCGFALLASDSSALAALTAFNDRSLDGFEAMEMPVCVDQELSGTVYWAGINQGTPMAELFYLVPLTRRGKCFWVKALVPSLIKATCEAAYDYNCSGIPYWTPDQRRLYGIIWPK